MTMTEIHQADAACISATVYGRVQGVFFRYFVQNAARKLGLTGYVRNLASGDAVEVQAEGMKPHLTELLEQLRIGPPGARRQGGGGNLVGLFRPVHGLHHKILARFSPQAGPCPHESISGARNQRRLFEMPQNQLHEVRQPRFCRNPLFLLLWGHYHRSRRTSDWLR
jgi:acylphosphatase